MLDVHDASPGPETKQAATWPEAIQTIGVCALICALIAFTVYAIFVA
jgi:hypothetical protein